MSDRLPLTSSLKVALPRKRDRIALAVIAGSSSIGSLCEVLTILCISTASLRIVGNAVDSPSFPFIPSTDSLTVIELVVVGVLLVVVRVLVMTVNSYVSARLSSSVLFRFRSRLSDAFFGAPWEQQTQQEQASIQVLTGTNVSNVTSLVQQASNISTALFGFLTFTVSAFVISPTIALALVVFGGVLFVALRPLNKTIRRLAGVQQSENRAYSRAMEEGISVALELRVFGVESEIRESLRTTLRRQLRARNAQVTLSNLSPQIYQSAGLLTILLGLAVVSKYEKGNLAVVGSLVLLMIRGLNYGQALQSNYTSAITGIPYVHGLIDSLEQLERDSSPRGDTLPGRDIEISLDGVSCGYADKVVLDGVSLTIEPGEAIGIVGPSGAGKSTLAALLMGLIEPRAGSFRIGGTEWHDIDRRWWAQNVSFVPQEPKLIAGTVEQNVRFMRSSLSDEHVVTAARSAHLSGELASWQDGLAHDVGPRGSKLSGGQKQRVCIARALVTDPQVLVLDEPTSALDSSAEESISDVLRELKGSTTLIIIAHRLSTIEMCDRVFRVSDRQVVEVADPREVAMNSELLEG